VAYVSSDAKRPTSIMEEGLVSVAKLKRRQIPALEVVTRDAHIIEPFAPAVRRSSPPVIALHKVWIQSAPGLQAFLLAICLFGQKRETVSADGTALLPSILNVDFDLSRDQWVETLAVHIELTVFVKKKTMVN